MPTSPLSEKSSVVAYKILSAGSTLPEGVEVLSIEVTQNLNTISQAEIVLLGGEMTTEKFKPSEEDAVKPGTEIEVQLGYEAQTKSVFKGVITKQTIRLVGSAAEVVITCKDKAVALTKIRKNQTFKEKKDSALIESVIGAVSGLSSSVTATDNTWPELTQSDSTDWDFINLRAAVNKMVVITDAGKVTVAKPEVASPVLKVEYGNDIYDFDTEVDASNQYSGVKCSAWDPSTQKMITATGAKPTENKQGNLSDSDLSGVLSLGDKLLTTSALMTKEQLQTWADASYQQLVLSRFSGTLTIPGTEQAKVNTTIELAGLGKRFDGNAYISGVTHAVEDGSWKTKLKFGLPTETFASIHDVPSPPAMGIIPGISGLQTGIVKKIDSDPNKEFRVQVSMPILGDNSDPIWARLATFYNGNQIGAYFMPELNDEVVLGFMNNDPRYPVILGSVYSSKIAAPETPDSDNSIKTLITKSKLQLKFDDKNKILTALTPAGNTMVFSDKDKSITVTDQNKNTTVMNDKGIDIKDKSENEAKMSSDGINVTDKNKNKIEMTSSGTTVTDKNENKIEMASSGINIKDKNQNSIQMAASGITIKDANGNQIQLNASGITLNASSLVTIKGSEVMIN